MPSPMPLDAPVTIATGFSLVFAVVAYFFDLFVILPTQITARIPLGKANRTRTFKGSRKAKRLRECLYFDLRGGLGSGLRRSLERRRCAPSSTRIPPSPL